MFKVSFKYEVMGQPNFVDKVWFTLNSKAKTEKFTSLQQMLCLEGCTTQTERSYSTN